VLNINSIKCLEITAEAKSLKLIVLKDCFFKGPINKRKKLILLIILKRIFVEIIKVKINKRINSNSEVAFKRIK
jgi:hypothetical protein